MRQVQYNIKLVDGVKDILFLLRHKESEQTIQEDVNQLFNQMNTIEILLILQELKSGDYGITSEDIKIFFRLYRELYGHSIEEINIPAGHPIHIFKEENREFEKLLNQINSLLESPQHFQEKNIKGLSAKMAQLGQFYSHYNRKEKLFFPIMERYGYYTPARIMWADDDRIRTLYKGAKRMMEKMEDVHFPYMKQAYHVFEHACRDMIFQEESFLLPIVQSIFSEDDWIAIARESEAFGYAIRKPKKNGSKTKLQINIKKQITQQKRTHHLNICHLVVVT